VADGLQPGERVAVHMPNLPQSVLAVHGVLAARGTVVMSNPLYTDDELVEQWKDAGVSVAIVGGWLWAERHARLAGALPVKRWLQTSLVEGLPWWLRPFARRKLASVKAELAREAPGLPRLLDAVARGRDREPPPPPAPRDIALLQYTGGTTGKSK